jgi:hypothetical protein
VACSLASYRTFLIVRRRAGRMRSKRFASSGCRGNRLSGFGHTQDPANTAPTRAGMNTSNGALAWISEIAPLVIIGLCMGIGSLSCARRPIRHRGVHHGPAKGSLQLLASWLLIAADQNSSRHISGGFHATPRCAKARAAASGSRSMTWSKAKVAASSMSLPLSSQVRTVSRRRPKRLANSA